MNVTAISMFKKYLENAVEIIVKNTAVYFENRIQFKCSGMAKALMYLFAMEN